MGSLLCLSNVARSICSICIGMSSGLVPGRPSSAETAQRLVDSKPRACLAVVRHFGGFVSHEFDSRVVCRTEEWDARVKRSLLFRLLSSWPRTSHSNPPRDVLRVCAAECRAADERERVAKSETKSWVAASQQQLDTSGGERDEESTYELLCSFSVFVFEVLGTTSRRLLILPRHESLKPQRCRLELQREGETQRRARELKAFTLKCEKQFLFLPRAPLLCAFYLILYSRDMLELGCMTVRREQRVSASTHRRATRLQSRRRRSETFFLLLDARCATRTRSSVLYVLVCRPSAPARTECLLRIHLL